MPSIDRGPDDLLRWSVRHDATLSKEQDTVCVRERKVYIVGHDEGLDTGDRPHLCHEAVALA
jgi:hypothetical protein